MARGLVVAVLAAVGGWLSNDSCFRLGEPGVVGEFEPAFGGRQVVDGLVECLQAGMAEISAPDHVPRVHGGGLDHRPHNSAGEVWLGGDCQHGCVAAPDMKGELVEAVYARVGLVTCPPASASAGGRAGEGDGADVGSGHGFGRLVLLGAVAAAAFLTEGTAVDWAGVHARRVLGADAATGSLVYTVFFVALTGVRFVADTVRARLGPAGMLRLAGGTASAGYCLVLLAPNIGAAGLGCAVTGWALTGAGMATVWPVVTSAVGSARTGTPQQLSMVAAISYSGSLAGPALIGYVAATTSLPTALIIPAALALMVAITGPLAVRAMDPCGDQRS